MKKFSIFSILMVLFLCISCSNLNNRNENGSIEFTTPQLPLNNISGAPVLPGIDSYFEVTITNIKNPNNQTHFVMDQNENQFVELAPGKYSIYIFGHTDDCEYEWQSTDDSPIVIKKNKVTTVSAKMWEKDPEYWFEQENNKYIPNNDDIAPVYSGKIEKNQIFAFWVNQDDAKETVKAGEKISGKISKKFIPHIITPEPLILNFKQTENEVSELTTKVYLDYSCSSDCQIKYLLNSETMPEDESAFANAPVYNLASGIDFASTSDMLTVYAIALPTEGDILHTASEIAIVEYKKCYGNSILFEGTSINTEASKLQLKYEYEIYVDKTTDENTDETTVEYGINQKFSINNLQDYISNNIKWYSDSKKLINDEEYIIKFEIPSDLQNYCYYENNITCVAENKNKNYEFTNFYDYFEVDDMSNSQNVYIEYFGKDDCCSLKVGSDYVDDCVWILDGKIYEKLKLSMENYGDTLICIHKNNYNGYDSFYICKTIVDIH